MPAGPNPPECGQAAAWSAPERLSVVGTPSLPEVGAVADVRVVSAEGELDPAAVIALQRQMTEAVRAGHRRIVIDLTGVTVVGVRASLMLGGALRGVGSRTAAAALVASPEPLRRVLELCAVEALEFHPDLDSAMRVLTAPAVHQDKLDNGGVPLTSANRQTRPCDQ